MESFFSRLKIERVHRHRYRTLGDARADTFDYVKRCYNPRRYKPGSETPYLQKRTEIILSRINAAPLP